MEWRILSCHTDGKIMEYTKKIGNWFDSLGNLLAIIFDLADKERAEKILALY